MIMQSNLTLRREFEEQGFIILRGFFSAEEVDTLKDEIVKAGEKLEQKSALTKGNLVFYSNVFRISPFLQAFASQQKIVDVLKDIIGPDFWVRWDQCVAKGPGGGAFPWHQDNAYNRLKDRHFQCWIGITEMTKENGGLWLQPGSHKLGLLPHEYVGTHLSCTVKPGQEVFMKAGKGDLILFSSLMLHHTKVNKSDKPRWAYVIEYMSNEHYDPLVKGPFFVAAEDGKPSGRFVSSYKGSRNVKNRLKYLGLQVGELKSRVKELIKKQ